MIKIAVINDLHIPFHDKDVCEMVLTALSDVDIAELWLNGDIFDLYNFNMHGPKNPVVEFNAEEELDIGYEFLANLRKRFPDKKIVFMEGNHETRLERYILKNGSSLYNLVSIKNDPRFKALNFEHHPYNEPKRVYNAKLKVQHSPPSYASAKTSLSKKLDCSYIWGCSHRPELHISVGDDGELYYGVFNGWLGDKHSTETHKKVFDYMKNHEKWGKCFTMIYLNENLEDFHLSQIVIKNNSFVLEGTRYFLEK